VAVGYSMALAIHVDLTVASLFAMVKSQKSTQISSQKFQVVPKKTGEKTGEKTGDTHNFSHKAMGVCSL